MGVRDRGGWCGGEGDIAILRNVGFKDVLKYDRTLLVEGILAKIPLYPARVSVSIAVSFSLITVPVIRSLTSPKFTVGCYQK